MRLENQYFLLRHGQTDWNHPKLAYPKDNATSVGLNRAGEKQIRVLARTLKKEGIDRIYSSDYLRTRQTAEIVARAIGLKPIFNKRLRDTRLGDYCGRPKVEYYRDFPVKIRFQKGPRGGEGWNEVRERMRSFLRDTEKKCDGKKILVVSHGDPLWLLEGAMRGLTNRELLEEIFVKKVFIKKGELKKIN